MFRLTRLHAQAALVRHPSVRAAVVGLHRPRAAAIGAEAELVAAVWLRESDHDSGATPVSAAEFAAFVGRVLPASMIPRAYYFVGAEDLPVTTRGRAHVRCPSTSGGRGKGWKWMVIACGRAVEI